ncbi:chitosanase [Methanosarcina hadiensis]|uniref:chitosanase n=1 Tax=Methanosarcina hadiensis TaxID=3078083 RepID=UPI003977D267
MISLIQPVYAGTTATSNDAYNKSVKMLAVCENNQVTPKWNYAENIYDNRGITFGAIGFTTGTWDGNILIKYYTELNPNNTLSKYIPALDAIDAGPHPYNDESSSNSTVGLDNFITDVNNIDDPLWQTAQLHLIQEMYWNPTVAAWNRIGASNQLTLAFLYNTNIRFGQDYMELFISGATAQCGGTPGAGVDENTYLRALMAEMDAQIVKEGWGDTDRNDGFKTLLEEGNVNLTTPFVFTEYGDSYVITGDLNLNATTPETDLTYPADAYNKSVQMLAVCENNQVTPKWNYAENIYDNRGITFGAIGFTTGTWDGNILIKYYTELNPNNTLSKYIPALDAIDAGPHPYNDESSSNSTVGLDNFITDVNNIDDPLWQTAQLHLIQEMYWNPTVAAWNRIGASNQLTLAFLYNTNIRFGQDYMELFISGATAQCGGTPGAGVDENTYLRALMAEMDAQIVKEGWGDTDRSDGFKTLLEEGNVNLTTPFIFTEYGDSYVITGDLNLNATAPETTFTYITPVINAKPATLTEKLKCINFSYMDWLFCKNNISTV